MTSVFSVLAGGAGKLFEVNAILCVAPVIPVTLVSVNTGSDPWISMFSIPGNVAVPEGVGVVIMAAEGVAVVLFLGATDGNVMLHAWFQLMSLYKSLLLEESLRLS